MSTSRSAPSNADEKKQANDDSSTGKISEQKEVIPPEHDPKKITVRHQGTKTWEDKSLLDWPENDFRMWVGDIGPEVSEDVLRKAFANYSSCQKVRIVRDIKTKKSKGYGFISFGNAEDYIRALREMNGRYVGSRPIRLRRSKWKERIYSIAKRKDDRILT